MGEGHEFRTYECPKCGHTKIERHLGGRKNGYDDGKRAA
jgi:predicted RNA-binding Zn-ribbon protein involved in translation (DUF1610 family)